MKDEESRKLLNHLFEGVSQFLELTFIAPPGVDLTPRVISQSYAIGKQRPDWQRVAEMNNQGWGVYYALTPKTRAVPPHQRSHEDNARWLQVLWVDIDLKDGVYPDIDTAFNTLAHFCPVPTVIISSGGGLHGLWRIEPVAVTRENTPRLKQYLRGLALAVQSDPSVGELARVFRLPGTVNTKPERHGARCELADGFIHAHRYPLSDFDPYAALAKPVTKAIQREFNRHKPTDLPAYVTWYLDTPHVEPGRNNALNWTAYKMASDGYGQTEATTLLLPRALADGLDETESLRTIQSAFKAPQGTPSYVTPRNALRMHASDAALGGGS